MKINGLDIIIEDNVRLYMRGFDPDDYLKSAIHWMRINNWDMKNWLKQIATEFPEYKEQLNKYLILL